MKETPLLFKAEMVRALLRSVDPKTQTRRPVVKTALEWLQPPIGFLPEFVASPVNGLSPYGYAGDRIWGKETHVFEVDVDGENEPPHKDGRPIKRRPADDVDCVHPLWMQPHYRATDPVPELDQGNGEPTCKWRPSIFMYRWASRLVRDLTEVRIERLQDISREDALAEGIVYCPRLQGFHVEDGKHFHAADPRESYWSLWESINGPGSVEANPWVWVLSFQRSQP